jgi:regulator of protease activity HflC (stomatin/prohibitin superfamily)
MNTIRNIVVGGMLITFFFVMLTVFFGSWYTIDQGERGVLLRNGAIVEKSVEPGLHFKTPWIDDVEYLSVQSSARKYEAMESYSRDQQPAHFTISVIYHIPADKVDEVYWRYGSQDGLMTRLLDRHVPQETKVVFGGYTALSVITDRAKFNVDVAEAIRGSMKDEPILIESIQVEDVKFSADYENAVRERMIAEVQVQKIRQQAEQQKVNAEITVINATAAANAVRLEAQGQADATRLRGDATAAAIKARGDALAANPGLVLLTQAERWNGTLPTTMVPGSSVPFLQLGR